jgi:hypothetical protein
VIEMMFDTKRLNWPTVALIAIAVTGMIATLAIVLTLTPESMLERLLELNWPAVLTGAMTTLVVLYGMARRAGLVHPRDPSEGDRITPIGELADDPTPAMGPRAMRFRDKPPAERSRRDGSVSPRLLATAIAVLAVAGLVAVLLSGCGGSALRQHANAARLTMVALEGAGQAIDLATDRALAACLADEGAEREACVLDVGAKATRAAAARDALIPAAHAYRAVALATCGEDFDACPEETPGLVEYLGVVASSVVTDWPTFSAAMRAFGIPVFSVPFVEEVSDGR